VAQWIPDFRVSFPFVIDVQAVVTLKEKDSHGTGLQVPAGDLLLHPASAVMFLSSAVAK